MELRLYFSIRARGRRAVRESRHVFAVAGSHATAVLLAAASPLEEKGARQFCLSLTPPSELPPWPPELRAEFLPRDLAVVAGKVCR